MSKTSFVANREATEAVQSGEGLSDNLAVTSKLLVSFDAVSCDASLASPAFAGLTASSEIIGLVGIELGRSTSEFAVYRWNGI